MALIHRSQLAGALPVCTTGDTRYFLDGVAVLPDGTTAATNGHVLVQLTAPEPLLPEDAPEKLTGASAPLPAPGDATSTVIRTADAKRLVAFTKNRTAGRIGILQAVAVTPTNGTAGQAVATDLDTQIAVSCVPDARFPNIAPVIPKLEPQDRQAQHQVTFDARVLRPLLDAAIAQSEAAGHGKRAVPLTFQFHGAEKQTRVDGEHFLGVVMPFRK